MGRYHRVILERQADMFNKGDIFEEAAQSQRAKAIADDANAGLQRRLAAKRAAETTREIASGLREKDGNWIESEGQGEPEEEEPE